MYGLPCVARGFLLLRGPRVNLSGLSLERCSGPLWISARLRFHRSIGSQCLHVPARPLCDRLFSLALNCTWFAASVVPSSAPAPNQERRAKGAQDGRRSVCLSCAGVAGPCLDRPSTWRRPSSALGCHDPCLAFKGGRLKRSRPVHWRCHARGGDDLTCTAWHGGAPIPPGGSRGGKANRPGGSVTFAANAHRRVAAAWRLKAKPGLIERLKVATR